MGQRGLQWAEVYLGHGWQGVDDVGSSTHFTFQPKRTQALPRALPQPFLSAHAPLTGPPRPRPLPLPPLPCPSPRKSLSFLKTARNHAEQGACASLWPSASTAPRA